MKTTAGQYYQRVGGRLEPATAGRPSVVICRRVADYAAGPPTGAAIATCACGAAIAYNPEGPHLDVPRVCMQCAGIDPLPF